VWAGVDSVWENYKLEARKMLENGDGFHLSSCMVGSPEPTALPPPDHSQSFHSTPAGIAISIAHPGLARQRLDWDYRLHLQLEKITHQYCGKNQTNQQLISYTIWLYTIGRIKQKK